MENTDGKREGNVLVCEGVEVEGIRERDRPGEENNSVQEMATGRIHERACKGRGTDHKDREKGSWHSRAEEKLPAGRGCWLGAPSSELLHTRLVLGTPQLS